MKGHLDVKDLESYRKADLVKLAQKLGVSTEGTIKQIAQRCAEVEVEIEDDGSGDAAEDQQATGDDAAADNAAQGQQWVEVIQDYHDLQLNRIVEKGERLTVTPERAEVLIEHRVAKRSE